MQKFLTGQSANEADKALKSSLQTLKKAKQNAVLYFEDILHRKLYRQLGYSTINQYAKLELGFSKSRTGDFLQLCRVFEELPNVKAKVVSGELGYTSARELAKVANKENEQAWLDVALNNPRRDLEEKVKIAKQLAADEAVGQASLLPEPQTKLPAAVVPVSVTLKMTPTQFARYEALWEQVRKQRNAPVEKVEALLEIMGAFVIERSPRGDLLPANKPAAQLHLHQCPECEKATVQTSKGELEISDAEKEQALCDCRISNSNGRNKASIAPSVRRKVLVRARYKCQRPGCDHTRFLEVHHKVPRAAGGSNELENLMAVCSACHALLHRQKNGSSAFLVKSPQIIYQWGAWGKYNPAMNCFPNDMGTEYPEPPR